MPKTEPEFVVEFEEVPEYRKAKRIFEVQYAEYVLIRAEGNVTVAARMAGKGRKDFYDMLRRNDLNPEDYRE